MMEKRFWLEGHSWKSLAGGEANQRGTRLPEVATATFTRAQSIWEAAVQSEITLKQAIDACRSCYALKPFGGTEDNIFVSIARSVLKPLIKPMSPALAATVQAVIVEYVSGLGTVHELEQVLNLIRFRYLSEA